jgi:hypothetical protein
LRSPAAGRAPDLIMTEFLIHRSLGNISSTLLTVSQLHRWLSKATPRSAGGARKKERVMVEGPRGGGQGEGVGAGLIAGADREPIAIGDQ